MSEQTFNQISEGVKYNIKNKTTLTIYDCPRELFEWFKSDIKENYGNEYWVKLLDLRRKSEFLDFLINSGIVTNQPQIDVSENVDEKEDKNEKDDKGIYTLGGRLE